VRRGGERYDVSPESLLNPRVCVRQSCGSASPGRRRRTGAFCFRFSDVTEVEDGQSQRARDSGVSAPGQDHACKTKIQESRAPLPLLRKGGVHLRSRSRERLGERGALAEEFGIRQEDAAGDSPRPQETSEGPVPEGWAVACERLEAVNCRF